MARKQLLSPRLLLVIVDQLIWILLTVVLPNNSSLAGGGGRSSSSSESGSSTPSSTSSMSPLSSHLSRPQPPACPASCSCRYGPHPAVESFYISCAAPATDVRDNHSIPSDASNISSLHLSNVSVSDVRPLLEVFSGLGALEWRESGLEEIPGQGVLPPQYCSNRSYLRMLDLTGNLISNLLRVGSETSTPCLLPLSTLILSRNNISDLRENPSVKGIYGSLVSLDLSWNSLEYLPTETFHMMTSLTSLNVSFNVLQSVGGSVSLVESLPRLENLDISHNFLTALSGIAVGDSQRKRVPLKTLNVSHNSLASLPIGTFGSLPHLEELDLSHNRLALIPAGVFGANQRRLKRLYLSDNHILAFGPGALTGLSGLHTLRVDHNELTQVEASYFSRSMPDTSPGWESDADGNIITDPVANEDANETRVWLHLHSVDLSHNNISDIAPSIFHSTLALVRHIDLAFNRITCLPRYGVETLTELESINVSHNHLQWLDIGTFKNARLRTINLSHNHLVKLISMAFLYLPAIEKVDLSYNQLDYIYKYAFYKTCAFNQRLNIYLQYNELVTDALWKVISSFRHLQGGECVVSLYMQNNSISYILGSGASDSYQKHLMLGDFHYFSIWDHINLYVNQNEVVCDCAMYQEVMLLEAVRTTFQHNFTHPEHLQFWHDLVCHSPPRLAKRRVSEVLQYMPCPLTKGCPEQCLCLFQPLRSVIEVRCSGQNLTQFPTILPPGRKELDLSRNRLGVLRGDINLTDVMSVDLTFNNLRYIDRQAWELLLMVPVLLLSDNALETLPWSDQNMSITLNITLGNNAFQCTCDNILFKDWLMEHFDKIYDAFNISCTNGALKGLPMLDVDDADFECFPEEGSRSGIPIGIFSLILGGTLVFGVLLGSLIYRYRLYLKLFCVQRWPWKRYVDDPERKTDVFVCYSFGDSKWVNRQLVPRLLSHFPPYSVLLQHRDTKPGALLSENLIDSIESSEITLLVLSYQFLRNEWLSDDCRYIIHQILQDDVHNVYVVLLDDTILDDLEPEVTECVRAQQCFSIREDWFWERLFHMLPPPLSANHRPKNEDILKAEMQDCAKY